MFHRGPLSPAPNSRPRHPAHPCRRRRRLRGFLQSQATRAQRRRGRRRGRAPAAGTPRQRQPRCSRTAAAAAAAGAARGWRGRWAGRGGAGRVGLAIHIVFGAPAAQEPGSCQGQRQGVHPRPMFARRRLCCKAVSLEEGRLSPAPQPPSNGRPCEPFPCCRRPRRRCLSPRSGSANRS